MDLSRKMTRAELKELSEEERKERTRLQKQKVNKKYREENSEKVAEINKKYRDNNTDKVKERTKKYQQTTNGKKKRKLNEWKRRGLHETKEELDRIYDLFLNQELCNACDCVLTRNGDRCSTQASMDHDHYTNRFRHIICRSCNTMDNWKKYFC